MRRVGGPFLILGAASLFACSANDQPAPNGSDPDDCGGTTCLSREIATWPMPNPGTLGLPNPARFEASAEVAHDLVTGLAFAVSFAPLSTYAEAEAYCDALELEGDRDYRVPTRIELISLLDRTRTPALDSRVFPGTPQDYFWTSAPLPENPEFRYSVYFGPGETGSGDASQRSAYARCVRAGKRRAPPRYAFGDDMRKDLGTGLTWQAAPSPTPLSLTAAADFCAPSSGAEWRLPTEKELQTLLTTDAESGTALIDEAAFSATPADDFWTATYDPVPPLIVSFATGLATVTDGAGLHYARCVR